MTQNELPLQPPQTQRNAGLTPGVLRPAAAFSTPLRIHGRWLKFARTVWVTLAIVTVLIVITALPAYVLKSSGQISHVQGSSPTANAVVFGTASALASLTSVILSIGLSWILFRSRFDETAVAVLSLYLLLYSVVLAGPLEFWTYYWFGSADNTVIFQIVLVGGPTIALFFLFPNGRLVPGWTRWYLYFIVPWNLILVFLPPSPLSPLQFNSITFGLAVLMFAGPLAAGIYAQIHRYRRVSTLEERQQTRWVLYGFALWFGYMALSTGPYLYLENLPPGSPIPWWAAGSELGWWLSLSILPISLTIAITRNRLWNIDIVVNRTLVYTALTGSVIAIYVAAITGLGLLFGTSGNLLISLLATGLAAVLFHPLRLRLQGLVNRLMYGERDDPVAVLIRLSEQLGRTGSPDAALEGMVGSLADTLKLPYVAIALRENNEHRIVASYGLPSTSVRMGKSAERQDAIEIFPLIHQNESVGRLLVERRAREAHLSQIDQRLLETVAQQAGAAAYAVQLNRDLRRARQRLITTREEERRRIRRDLHDGLGPQLASQTLTLDAIDKLIARDPETARALIQDLKAQSRTAIEDIRGLIYDLRPPALDDLGLVEALREETARLKRNGLQIEVQGPDRPLALPAAVELAAYRIAQEAVNNTLRHAQARHCKVNLTLGAETLIVEVSDDGCGLPENLRSGVGLHSMRERAEELGGRLEFKNRPNGGVRITARLPL